MSAQRGQYRAELKIDLARPGDNNKHGENQGSALALQLPRKIGLDQDPDHGEYAKGKDAEEQYERPMQRWRYGASWQQSSVGVIAETWCERWCLGHIRSRRN